MIFGRGAAVAAEGARLQPDSARDMAIVAKRLMVE